MKQTKTLVLLLAFFGLAIDLSAQTEKLTEDEITKRRLEYKMSHARRVMDQPAEINVNDSKYAHREKEILEKLNTDAIPADFPVYKPEYSSKAYSEMMDAWYAANPSLLRKKTETNSNQQK